VAAKLFTAKPLTAATGKRVGGTAYRALPPEIRPAKQIRTSLVDETSATKRLA
jgi:hypothetical protein